MQHEALINAALADRQLTALCLYDAGRLEDDVLAGARATHPLVWKFGALQRSAEYAPDDILANCNQPLPGNPGAVTYMVRQSTDLRRLGRSLSTTATGSGCPRTASTTCN